MDRFDAVCVKRVVSDEREAWYYRIGQETKVLNAQSIYRWMMNQMCIRDSGISVFLRMEGRPVFYALSTHPNVEIKIYNPVNILLPWRLQGWMHDKYMMVDEKAYLLGGRNSFDYFIGNYETENNSLDREVLVYNPGSNGSIKQLETYFDSVWYMGICRLFHDDSRLAAHPRVCLLYTSNTDNMTVSNTTVRRELQLLADTFHLSEIEIGHLIKNAEESMFENKK